MSAQPLQDYISRLSGRPVAFDEVISLSSAQQAAMRSWLRKNSEFGVPARVKSRVSAKMLAGGEEPAGDGPAARPMEAPAPVERGSAIAGVGLDIEYASTLPEAEDYRTHPFYVDNFSKSEIVHCIEKDNPRLSFAGLWAAKEAIAKARGIIDARLGALARIEIRHDENGRPTCAFGSISICHAGEIAMAVCLASPAHPSEPVAGEGVGVASADASDVPLQPPAVSTGPRVSRSVLLALGLSAIVNILLGVALFQTYHS